MLTTRGAAAELGYSICEAECSPTRLVFARGLSRASKLTVDFEASSASSTVLTVTSSERSAFTDWGRSKRACRNLLDLAGATASNS
jgi:hypothetical protein